MKQFLLIVSLLTLIGTQPSAAFALWKCKDLDPSGVGERTQYHFIADESMLSVHSGGWNVEFKCKDSYCVGVHADAVGVLFLTREIKYEQTTNRPVELEKRGFTTALNDYEIQFVSQRVKSRLDCQPVK